MFQPAAEGAPLAAHHPAALRVLKAADRQEGLADDEVDAVVANIMRREAHMCTARYLGMLQEGLPLDAAEMLAQDDMGFQLVVRLAQLI